MEDKPFYIAELITKLLKDELSAEELAALNRLIDDETRIRILETYRNDQHIQKRLDFIARVDQSKELAWQRVIEESNIKNSGKKSGNKLYGFAAAILFFCLIGTCTWWYIRTHKAASGQVVPDLVYGYKNDVLPGSNQAELILSDGKKVVLGRKNETFTEIDGTRLTGSEEQLSYNQHSEPSPQETILYNTLRVPKAGTYRVVLPDGSKVWLNALSELKFPVNDHVEHRTVFLKGEAYFEIATDKQRPFKVIVDEQEVDVLGTTFNLNAYDEKRVRTTLVSGKVSLSNQGWQQILTPGELGICTKAGIKVEEADIEKSLAWKNGYFYFKHDKIVDVLDDLSRWYDIKVVYQGNIPQTNFGGTISRNVTLAEALQILKDVSKLNFEIEDKVLTVKI